MPTTLDAPFHAPLECVLDLPFPPSTNRVWRSRAKRNGVAVYRSNEYREWLRIAGVAAVASGSWRKRVPMPDRFSATILLDRSRRRGDADNRIKAVLDWAQRVELVRDDRLCEEVTARWVISSEAPAGCRLILRSIA
jgi:Holliday junction resolvase RusA-like endonuclease